MTRDTSSDNSQLLALLPLINKTISSAAGMKEFGYTKTQFYIFSALSRKGNLTMSQVASFISSSKEQATRAVAPLVDHGMVERYVDPENRTKVHIRLTEDGIVFMEEYKQHFFINLQSMMREKITQEEKLELKQAVEVMIRILSKLE